MTHLAGGTDRVLRIRRLLLRVLPVVGLAVAVFGRGAAADESQRATTLTERQKVVHVLNRLGFGPRAGDVERVEKMGIEAYVRQQLHPETIDDAAAEKAVAGFDTLSMSSAHLMEQFYSDVKRFFDEQMASGNADEVKLRYGVDPAKVRDAKAATRPASPAQGLANRDALRSVAQVQQAKIVRAALSERQLNEVLVDFWSNHFNIDVKKPPVYALKVADDRDVIRPHVLGKFRELLGASAHSPAMLLYLDNQENSVARQVSGIETKAIVWYVSYRYGMNVQGLVPTHEGPNENYGRELLELHTLGVDAGYTQKDVQEVARCFSGWSFTPFTGGFQFYANRHDNGQKVVLGTVIPAGGGVKDGELVLDLLARHPATARHIAYQLCQRFVADEPPSELVGRVAKVFLDTDGDLRRVVETIVTSDEFFSPKAYRAKIKSPFEYVVSAVRATGGEFTDPAGSFDAADASWAGARGDAANVYLREVREGAGSIGYGAERLSEAKQKSLNWHVHDMGQPLFGCAPPTGYPESSAKWVSPGALIDRLNFALALTEQQVIGVKADPAKLAAGVDADQPRAVLDRLVQGLLQGDVSAATRKVLEKTAVPTEGEGKTVNVGKLTALILGSPEFQRR